MQPDKAPNTPSFAEENAMRVASESLSFYDQENDVYNVSYGPPAPSIAVEDPDRGVIVRIDPHTRQVLGFSIPDFRAWHAEHAEDDGGFEVDLPPVWGARDDAQPG